MPKYKVYFELYGKKMVKTIDAEAIELAKIKVKESIIFHKIEGDKSEFDEALDFLNSIIKT